jgi:hypothetical protein
MTITFDNDNDVIVYAFKKVIAYARRTQQIFVAQCVWWLASAVGLESGLVIHIDNLHGRTVVEEPLRKEVSPVPRDIQEELRQDDVLKECEQYLQESRRLRDIASLKAKGRTTTGRINPTPIAKKNLWKKNRYLRKREIREPNKTAGIDEGEIQRRKGSGECLRCAWPADRKGAHQVKDCNRPIKLDTGTAEYPKGKKWQQIKPQQLKATSEEASSVIDSSKKSSDDSL